MLRRLVIKAILTEPRIGRAYDLAGASVGMLTRDIITMERRPAG